MAVTVGQRHVPDTASVRKLYAIDAAFKLEQHTLKCCKNKKYFTDEYDDAITNKLIDAATGAYDDACVANGIRVTSVDTWIERRDLQKSAIRKVARMRPRLNSARRCNHLRKGKVEYWIGLVLDAQELLDGTWKNSEPREILITYPKRRTGLSIPFRDRVYQRSINDNVLYPQTTKHFIDGNAACQKDRGTSYARKLAKKYLWRMYRNYGKNFYVLQIDVKGYYPNMRHDVAYECIRKYVSSNTADAVESILSKQYKGDVGFNPGSQMVQIVGISLLSDIDHYIKERLHIKNYIRYMDDFFVLHENADYLNYCKDAISKRLEAIGLKAHPDKTHITHIKDGFELLGFKYRMTDTGKVIMSVNSQNVKHEKRKLRRMVNKCKRGEMSKRKVNECFGDWKETHAKQGNSYNLMTRINKYYKELWRNDNEDSKELRA